MLFRLKQFYNQNRKKIWTFGLIIVFILALLQLLNYLSKNKVNTKENSNSSTNSTTITATTDTKKNIKSAITDITISENESKENNDVIKNFIDYCNNGEINKAYALLSKECKEIMFTSVEYFENNYCNKIFTEKKIYDLQSWLVTDDVYTYKVSINSDMLATGNASSTSEKTDYFTIIEEEQEKRLNINNYIYRKRINKTTTKNNIELLVRYKDVYVEYEEYNISIKNKNENSIMMDSKENTKTVYLLDDNDVKYSSYLHEIDKNLLIFGQNQRRTIKLKFNKTYGAEKVIKSINFTNIILNYEEYLEDKEKYKNIITMLVEV